MWGLNGCKNWGNCVRKDFSRIGWKPGGVLPPLRKLSTFAEQILNMAVEMPRAPYLTPECSIGR
jgi:hypothetical protein